MNDEAVDEQVFAEIDLNEAVLDAHVEVDARLGIAVHYQIRPVVIHDAR